MPIIPVQRQLLSTNVPGASGNPEAAGAIERAVGQVGAKVADTSLQLLHQIKVSEAHDASESAHHGDRIESEIHLSKLKLESPDGNMRDEQGVLRTNADGTPVTVTQSYREWANSRFEKNQLGMPSEAAQQMYKQKSGAFFSSQVASAFTDEQSIKLQAARVNKSSRDQSRFNSLVDLATPTKIYETSNESRLDWQTDAGKLYSHPFAQEQMKKNDQQIAESAGKFAVNQVMATPSQADKGFLRRRQADQWIALITEDPAKPATLSPESRARKQAGLPILSEMFDPDKKAIILHQLMSAKAQADNFDVATLNAKIKNVNAMVDIGKPVSQAVLSDIGSGIGEAIKLKYMSPEIAAQHVGNMAMTAQVQKLRNSLALMPDTDQDQAVEMAAASAHKESQAFLGNNPATSQMGGLAQKSATEKGNATKQLLRKERETDWAAFMQKHENTTKLRDADFVKSNTTFTDPRTMAGKGEALTAQINASENTYASVFPGRPEFFRVLSKPESEQMGSFFRNPNRSNQEKAQALRIMAQEYGPNYSRIMTQMIEDKSVPEKWRFAALFGSQSQTEDMVSALTSSSRSEEIKAWAAANEQSESVMDTKVWNKFEGFIKASALQNPDGSGQMLRSTVIEVAKSKAMASIIAGNATNWDDAVDKAYDSLIKNNWHVVKSRQGGFLGFGGREYNMVIPRQSAGREITDANAQTLVDYSQNIMSPSGLKALGIVSPNRPGGAPSTFGEQYYDQVAKESGRVVFNEKRGGLEIWWHNKYYNTDMRAQVKDQGGKMVPLFIPLDIALNHAASHQDRSPDALGKPIPANEVPLSDDVTFKSEAYRMQLEAASPMLRSVVNHIAYELKAVGENAKISRVTEKFHGESGVHQTGRAVDFSTKGVDKKTIQALETTINMNYPRDDGKPTLMYHKQGKAGTFHLHLQVAAPRSRKFMPGMR